MCNKRQTLPQIIILPRIKPHSISYKEEFNSKCKKWFPVVIVKWNSTDTELCISFSVSNKSMNVMNQHYQFINFLTANDKAVLHQHWILHMEQEVNILLLNVLFGNTHSWLGFKKYKTVIKIKFVCDVITYLLHKSKLFLSFEIDYRRSLSAGKEIAYKDFVWYYQFSTRNHNRGSHSKFWVISNNFQLVKIYIDKNE